jgi:hypothetical protein
MQHLNRVRGEGGGRREGGREEGGREGRKEGGEGGREGREGEGGREAHLLPPFPPCSASLSAQ